MKRKHNFPDGSFTILLYLHLPRKASPSFEAELLKEKAGFHSLISLNESNIARFGQRVLRFSKFVLWRTKTLSFIQSSRCTAHLGTNKMSELSTEFLMIFPGRDFRRGFWRLQTNSITSSFLRFKIMLQDHYRLPYSEATAGHSSLSFFFSLPEK